MPKRKEIEKITKELRSSREDLWIRIRQLLLGKGLNPKSTVLAYSYPEDYQFEFGIIVTEDESIFQYGFDFLHKNVLFGTFKEWIDITDKYEKTSFCESIETALKVLHQEKESPG